jgi:uncharacterized RDD family membrane protein YckC
MPCLICGEICRCPADARSVVEPRWLPDIGAEVTTSLPVAKEPAATPVQSAPAQPGDVGESQKCVPEDSTAWRQELADRLNRYQSRRKPRPPRYPSLRLRFDDPNGSRATNGGSTESVAFPQTTNLALDEFSVRADDVFDPVAVTAAAPEAYALRASAPISATAESSQLAARSTLLAAAPTTAKIIEFPRSWTPAPPPVDELAEPVISRPRILEAPEVVPPPPALGGITIESVQQCELEKRPGIDIPLQSAPLGRRVLSAVIDDVIVAAACLLFGYIFWKMTAFSPPRFQILGIAAGIAGVFCAAYQYLFLVYCGTTPGLRVARLELARFDGSPVGRRLRRWRAFASFLSAVSLGMGYAWVFLDEDALCWHDRITQTYLAPQNRK